MNQEFLQLFPCPTIKIDSGKEFKNIQEKIIEYIYAEKNDDPMGIVRSNVNGWHSQVKLHEKKDFKIFLDFILKCIAESCSSYFSDETDIVIKSCWANINQPNSMNDWHQHPGCDMSGCFWIKCPNDCGSLVFRNPFDFEHNSWILAANHNTKEKYKFSHNYYFSPVEGTMLLFPSNMYHKVLTNNSNEDRISLAFNIKLYE